MTLINSFFNSALFWAAWVIIPFIMEIIPSLMSAFVLIFKLIKPTKYKDPGYWPEVTLIIPVYNSEDTLANCIRSIIRVKMIPLVYITNARTSILTL